VIFVADESIDRQIVDAIRSIGYEVYAISEPRQVFLTPRF
jgi:hypothetical protein